MSVDDITVDLGPPITLFDAKAVGSALQVFIDNGYFSNPEMYAAVIDFKARLKVRIAKAEMTQRADIALEDVL